jgi:hypothetical protein
MLEAALAEWVAKCAARLNTIDSIVALLSLYMPRY